MVGPSPIRLLVTSGNGPEECRIAVRHVLKCMEQEAARAGVAADVTMPEQSDRHGPASAVVTLRGPESAAIANRWIGSVRWTAQSPVRPNHRRRNWYVGVFTLTPGQDASAALDRTDVRFETFRAGGPGGQHQNTTDSAVRATHLPSGISVVSRDQRSQHRNKQMALDRLAAQLALRHSLDAAKARNSENQLHRELERGNPVRCFKGGRFVEV